MHSSLAGPYTAFLMSEPVGPRRGAASGRVLACHYSRLQEEKALRVRSLECCGPQRIQSRWKMRRDCFGNEREFRTVDDEH
ncbi:hypothetical protein NDU88_009251 [Pleurodeles waltl]|uniref:Uncharacterized protein n=1 Tax=Pleurodeles waltl TaxID=8319 RepID=A0AAV7QV83_PLEWA|nr:hypothetical protein NDU88_009251 [Pleurodeles waltl]